MTEAVVAQKGPYPTDLEPGTYWWCACGRSATQPYCDGSHKDTGFTPVRYETSEAKKVWFCGCKASSNAPLCDGSHNQL